MARYTGPKDRLSRREGMDLFGAGNKIPRLNVTPGMHGPKGQLRAPSQYGRQLREKQKVKRNYGLMEAQFAKYVNQALNMTGNTGDNLFSILETRLDNVVFRLGLAESRPQARQLVSHKHVFVNGKKVNIPSFTLKVGDSVTLDSKTANLEFIKKLLADKDKTMPGWLTRKGPAGKVKRMPTRQDLIENFSEQDIVEFYSR